MPKELPKIIEQYKRVHFWSRVRISDKERCWEWTGCLSKKGYGQASFKHIIYYVHRVAFFLHYDEDITEYRILHRCDNRKCCNPFHMFKGTQKDNIKDMVNKKRHTRGNSHWKAKVNETQVLEIREARESGIPAQKIADQYGLTRGMIYAIQHRRYWKDI